MRYTAEQLINNVCEKNNFRNSGKNHKKLENCGIMEGEKIQLGNNCSVVFFASHGGITKKFYWGTREVRKETVTRRILSCEN